MESKVCIEYEDASMDANQLQAKYSDNPQGHPEYTLDTWRAGPIESPEFSSYWDWVVAMIAAYHKANPVAVESVKRAAAPEPSPEPATIQPPTEDTTSTPVAETPVVSEKTKEDKPSVTKLDTIDDMAKMVLTWHSKGVQELEHLMDIPEGTTGEFQIDGGAMQTMEISGEKRDAFRMGIHTALCILGKLPFYAMPDQETTDQ